MASSHLIKRFFGSYSASALTEDEQAWVDSNLLQTERLLWRRMSKADSRHAHGVAQKVVARLGDKATRPVVAAALLHDIGKVEAQIGTLGRVVATLAGQTASEEQRQSWKDESGWLGRAGKYLNHHHIGADLLSEAGSDPITVTWAREHELHHTKWTLPDDLTDALWKSDN